MRPVVWSEKGQRGWERGCSEVQSLRLSPRFIDVHQDAGILLAIVHSGQLQGQRSVWQGYFLIVARLPWEGVACFMSALGCQLASCDQENLAI